MKVVLLERVEKLGAIGDVVNVRPGFARNFLLPQEKALRATEANLARFEREREILEKRNAERASAARSEGEHLEGASFVLIRQASESGQLYGSVSTRDIAEAASSDSLTITRGMVDLNQPIKTLGVHSVRLVLHPEVAVDVTVNVARTPEEAERQAKGEDVIAAAAEEDRALADAQAAELFEASAEGAEERAGAGDEE
ncbi:MAG: 50S ribosomal protein L9 [Oceanicaulis sp.]|uniref:50S ribosomal protein L9 n=1 Tax=Glycocaulis sp. TaxID=1969725 RepID=UPI0025C64016|nr:50S ribosomal protein L9 [Glycocaulis sp.]MCC5981123.1 50S ribosomal protein L9 [Oceanicaulis sp.]MCH8521870.1 50S ribosomal protein L9 [Glycocaulis sp.]